MIPDPLEPDPLVGADRPLVRHRRVDGDPVVAALLEELPGQRADGVGAETLSPTGGGHEDVDAGVPVVGLVLLHGLDEPDHVAALLDDEDHRLLVRAGLVAQVVLGEPEPPVRDLRLGRDLGQPRSVLELIGRSVTRSPRSVSTIVSRRSRGRSRRPSPPCPRRLPG